jgi:15-cis-phytoene synthase
MEPASEPLSPPKMVAIAYAKAVLRRRWALLVNLDARLQSVVARGTEPLLIQMRLAWWHEQIERGPNERAKGEPLLAELSAIELAQPEAVIAHYATMLVDAWEMLATADDADQEQFAKLRGAALFGSYAHWAGTSEAMQVHASAAGTIWALADIGIANKADNAPKLRGLKPLSLLLLAATGQLSEKRGGAVQALKFYWHILTGR